MNVRYLFHLQCRIYQASHYERTRGRMRRGRERERESFRKVFRWSFNRIEEGSWYLFLVNLCTHIYLICKLYAIGIPISYACRIQNTKCGLVHLSTDGIASILAKSQSTFSPKALGQIRTLILTRSVYDEMRNFKEVIYNSKMPDRPPARGAQTSAVKIEQAHFACSTFFCHSNEREKMLDLRLPKSEIRTRKLFIFHGGVASLIGLFRLLLWIWIFLDFCLITAAHFSFYVFHFELHDAPSTDGKLIIRRIEFELCNNVNWVSLCLLLRCCARHNYVKCNFVCRPIHSLRLHMQIAG